METLHFNKLLLKTAFSCMACDGHIDKRELKLIKQLQNENNLFSGIDINSELDTLLLAINKDDKLFFRSYFNELTSSELSEANELKLIEIAIATIKSDDLIEYSEIKFFKVIRSKLKIDNYSILEKHPDFEDYLEHDIISDSYLSRLQDDFFDTHSSTKFELKSEMGNDFLNNLKEKN